MKRSLPVFLGVFFVSALAAFPQGSYLKKGQYGFGLSGAYATNSGASGFSGTAGVALSAFLDLTFSTGRVTYDTPDFSSLKSTTFSPLITAYVIKQNSSNSPVTVSISAGYARDNYSSPDLDEGALKMWADSILLGAAVHRDVRLFGDAYLQPFAGLGYTDTALRLAGAGGQTLRANDSAVTFELGLPLVYGFSDRTMLVIEPSLGFNKDATTFAISVGFVYVLPKSKN
jgi:hypothetical protein